MSTINVSFDEVLHEIERLSQRQPDGFTVREMSMAVGKSPKWCRERLRDLIDAQKVEWNGEKTVLRMDGRPAQIPVYRWLT